MMLQTSMNNEIRREAMYVFTNLITTVQDAQFHLYCVEIKDGALLYNMVAALQLPEPNLIIEVLQALNVLLALDAFIPLRGEDAIAYKFEVAKGLDELESLQTHPNISIYKEVEQIIKNYFKDDTDSTMANSAIMNRGSAA
jgi:hypothetical protein